jgi:2-isopropylmalate synthase
MVEWFCCNIKNRQSLIISVHTHNDRGTAIAKAEFALLAGADRVEGTVTGGGERAGNCSIATLALNTLAHGIHPGLELFDVVAIKERYEALTGMSVSPRQPYLGELSFTALSGGHQDAIRKALAHRKKVGGRWSVPYCVLDPTDIGWNYELVRFNGQSGGSGVAHILEEAHGLKLPKDLAREFAKLVEVALRTGSIKHATKENLAHFFREVYVRDHPLAFIAFDSVNRGVKVVGKGSVRNFEDVRDIEGEGNCEVSAFVDALIKLHGFSFEVSDLHQHSLGDTSVASSIAYVEITNESGVVDWGVGEDPDVRIAPLKAVVSAVVNYRRRSL